jgi:predicted phosphohydrolase
MTNNDSLTTVGSGDNSISCAVGHPSANTIVFISDLHFDYTAGKYRPSDAAKRQQAFMDFIKGYYSNCVLCLAGDYYDNYQETLSFIKELEENRIVGFFVLGNHDYWNDRTRSHDDIIRIFNSETRNNNYFRFLVAGKKFYINDVCVIGDTGWTSFISKSHDVSLEQFMSLPDVNKVRGFQPKKIREGHDKWIAYAILCWTLRTNRGIAGGVRKQNWQNWIIIGVSSGIHTTQTMLQKERIITFRRSKAIAITVSDYWSKGE